MSCKTCEKIQEEILNKSYPIAYVRVGVANLAIIGCREHIKELLDQLRSSEFK